MIAGMEGLVFFLDLLGVAVFAATGALVASRREMDIIGFALMASVTGVGGGTLRDVILDRPVFWIADPLPIGICLAVAVLLYFAAPIFQRRYTVLLWADAFGIALYGTIGAEIALRAAGAPLVAIVMGLMTATFGGLIRDVICNETPLILNKEVYATAAVLAACLHIGLSSMGVPFDMSAGVAVASGFLLRAGGIKFGWSLPTYKARPGREY